jgi:hypothetical protein
MSGFDQFLPHRGRGTTRRVVEGHVRPLMTAKIWTYRVCPSTMLCMVPLPVSGRNFA